ncbi:MAG: PEGA domain-containing protein [Parachlamydiaceae bacterium]
MNKLIISSLLILSSCATIINGPTQKVPLTSYPAGAMVEVDGCYVGHTPLTVSVNRNMDHIVTFSKEGYVPQTYQLTHVMSAAVAGNIIAGGLVGWGVDAVTGSQYRIVPETLAADLTAPYGLVTPCCQ